MRCWPITPCLERFQSSFEKAGRPDYFLLIRLPGVNCRFGAHVARMMQMPGRWYEQAVEKPAQSKELRRSPKAHLN